ncbi:hypothetical protein Q8W71_02090 [Methylobacterium sp. NEAU 140]|uniref:hypothetical protein n=1 Tax=Methylobacterium sp. NEAU 140 TaxID=3064945 RepID=UPI00273775CC|nr:hypothetical protein [Methylobacterium sp. NEAU 140]MDP4021400.1 hypothetical protein [Methylobacterium sp. NEAU 140]
MTADRRPPAPPGFEPRAVVDGAGRALQEHAAPPPDSFADGVEAHRALRRMCPEPEAGCDLGHSSAGPSAGPSADPADGAAPLGGRARTIRFPAYWHAWFSRQTEPRLATLDELVDERIERRVLLGFLRRLKHAALLAFVSAAAAAHWFSDQIAWLVERVPALRAFWHLVTGSVR